MKQKNDFSLLRPFDIAAAKDGEPVCWDTGDYFSGRYLAGPDRSGEVAFEDNEGDLYLRNASKYRMAPLCWIEGKPVYKGDVLYRKGISRDGEHFIAESIVRDEDGDVFLRYAGNGGSSWVDGPEGMGVDATWPPPKVKREVKLLAYLDADQLFWLRETVQPKWPAVRVPLEDMVVTVEEPAEVQS